MGFNSGLKVSSKKKVVSGWMRIAAICQCGEILLIAMNQGTFVNIVGRSHRSFSG
jgi:hypothetical protein